MEVVNSNLCQLYALTQPLLLPRLASIAVRQRSRGCGEEQGDPDLARIFGSLMMLLQLGEGSGVQQACMQARGLGCAEPILAPSVSIQGGAWRFSGPLLERGICSGDAFSPCMLVQPVNFSFSLRKCA